MKNKASDWLVDLATAYRQYLQDNHDKNWAEYCNWLEHNCFWAYLGTYESTEQAKFLAQKTFSCDLFDAWVFLIWLETIWRYHFCGQGVNLTAEELIGQIAAFLEISPKHLKNHWEKRSINRTPLMKNPALQGALSLANFSNLLHWLQTDNKEQAAIRARSVKRVLLEGAIHIAWADNKLLFDEKEGLRYQIAAAGLNGEQTDNLLKLLDKNKNNEDSFRQYLELLKRSKLTTLEQRILLTGASVSSLLDGTQSEVEQRYLEAMAGALGLETQFLQSIAVEITQVLADSPAIAKPSQARWILGRLQRKLTTDLTDSLQDNAARIWQEVQQTGDLFMLLSKAAAGVGLTEFEMERVKSQLADIAKVVPALAIFMLPGGMVFLGILLKVLPFNIMPSAFNKKEETNEIN